VPDTLIDVLLGLAATAAIWALPWVMQRQTDVFSWRGAWTAQVTSVWWGSASIVSFAMVFIAGRAYGIAIAGVAAVVLVAVFAWTFRQRFGGARKLQALCEALDKAVDKPGGEAALAALEFELARRLEMASLRANGYEAWARWSLHAAAHAARAGFTAQALRFTESIEPLRVGASVRGAYTQHLTSFRMSAGDRIGARAALAGAARPAEPPVMEEALQGLEALLDAVEGSAREALMRADAVLAREPTGPLRAIWLATRAHALAGVERHAEARDVLRALRVEQGDEVLKRIVRHAGPASAAAESVLASQAPYR
jgi:hypothetical protein